MKIINNRRTALMITAAVIVVATLFGMHRSLSKEVRRIEKQFYDGVFLKTEGYTENSIESHLNNRLKAALGLVTVAANYSEVSEETAALRSARENLMNARGITEKYAANERLQKEYDILASKLAELPLKKKDVADAAVYSSTFFGAQASIRNSGYNSLVSGFINGTLRAFPVNVLKNIAFVKAPEYFELEG